MHGLSRAGRYVGYHVVNPNVKILFRFFQFQILSMNDEQPIIIIGAGPTGIGAARRFQELGAEWLVLEKEDYVGGLAASFTDEGYVWDIGGHVIFSHYAAYNGPSCSKYPNRPIGPYHKRVSWVVASMPASVQA